jgi:peptidoglycan/xylan/chitin deacetylase (PgdA/CDA1 family)
MMGGGVITGVVAGASAGSAIVAALGAAHIGPQAIRPSAVSRMRSLCWRKRMLCLTYDDGPGPDLTPRVLGVLQRHDARATFFLLGVRAEYQPGLVDRAVASGHEIGCHSARHLNGWKTTPARAREDVEAGYHMLERWIAPGSRFRPPYGKLSLGQYLALRKRRAPINWWTLDSGDTKPRLPAAESIWARVQRGAGGVVLMHDMDREHDHAARAEYVLQLTDLLLTRSKESGIRPATLSELFAGEPS